MIILCIKVETNHVWKWQCGIRSLTWGPSRQQRHRAAQRVRISHWELPPTDRRNNDIHRRSRCLHFQQDLTHKRMQCLHQSHNSMFILNNEAKIFAQMNQVLTDRNNANISKGHSILVLFWQTWADMISGQLNINSILQLYYLIRDMLLRLQNWFRD